MRQRFFLIFNASAGTSRVAAVAALIAALEAGGGRVTRAVAASAAAARVEAAAAARSGNYDALIACGGDGTVRQAAAAAAGTACPVGAFMLGTGNVLAHELSLPRQPATAAALFLAGPSRSVGMGLANGDPFLLMAGIGLDGRIVAALDQSLKQRVAKVAYVPATLSALRAPLDDLSVEIDGSIPLVAQWVIITAASRYGGGFRLTAATDLDRGGLIAVLFQAQRKADLVRHAVAIARGRLDELAALHGCDVTLLACRHARIQAAAPVPVQLDGDVFGATPLTVSADGPRVHLIAPQPHSVQTLMASSTGHVR